MLVRDGEQTGQPMSILAVCDLSVEQFKYMPLARLQVELETVPQCIQVATIGLELVAELFFPAEHLPQGDHCRTDALCKVDRANTVIVLPQPGETYFPLGHVYDRHAFHGNSCPNVEACPVKLGERCHCDKRLLQANH